MDTRVYEFLTHNHLHKYQTMVNRLTSNETGIRHLIVEFDILPLANILADGQKPIHWIVDWFENKQHRN